MRSRSAHDLNLEQLRNGAAVVAVDYAVGTLERLESRPDDRQPRLIVRHGYDDHLLAIPLDLVADISSGMVKLKVHRADVETMLYEHTVQDGGPTTPSPMVDAVLGKPVVEPPDGPATG